MARCLVQTVALGKHGVLDMLGHDVDVRAMESEQWERAFSVCRPC
jgi:hypothetical protein